MIDAGVTVTLFNVSEQDVDKYNLVGNTFGCWKLISQEVSGNDMRLKFQLIDGQPDFQDLQKLPKDLLVNYEVDPWVGEWGAH